MKRLFKKGDKVNVSGDFSNKDYNVRISSPAVVETDQKTSRSNVWVNIAEVDGDLDYDEDTVECYDSSMTLMHDTDEYDKKEHFEIILGMLNVTQKDGWKQVAGPSFVDE